MKTKILLITALFAVMVAMTGTVAATDLDVTLNTRYGTGNFAEVVDPSGLFPSGSYDITVIGKFGIFDDSTGYYVGSTETMVFSTPAVLDSGVINPSGSFGLFIKPGYPDASTIFYSEKSKNGDAQLTKVYNVDVNGDGTMDGYVISFEDLEGPTGDLDDLILELKPSTASVPEFPTVAMPIIAVIGMMFLFQRKKSI